VILRQTLSSKRPTIKANGTPTAPTDSLLIEYALYSKVPLPVSEEGLYSPPIMGTFTKRELVVKISNETG
jgi:hypothetical protein